MVFKRHLMAVLTACALAGSGAVAPARAATVAVDQNNPSVGGNFCFIFAANVCGQSFRQTGDTLAGAGLYISPYAFNQGGAITLSVFSTYGRSPSGLLASGTQTAGQSGWVDVFWNAVSVNPGQTYYLVASSPSVNIVTFAGGNTYGPGNALFGGNAYAYGGYDLTFRTYVSVPEVVVTPPTTLPAAVPLPASLTLLLGALGITGFMRRRRTV